MIAHRLSPIQTADVIVALDSGRVVEWGTHAELMDKEGLYYDLVTAQMRKDQEDKDGTSIQWCYINDFIISRDIAC